eukprot:scaffold6203_cov147-Isochrysis_galbana.AAC.4
MTSDITSDRAEKKTIRRKIERFVFMQRLATLLSSMTIWHVALTGANHLQTPAHRTAAMGWGYSA